MATDNMQFLEGVFHVIFQNYDGFRADPFLAANFYNQVKDNYPNILAVPDLSFTIPTGPGQGEFFQTPITRFGAQNNSLVQIGKDNFIYNHIPPYISRKTLIPEILDLLSKFVIINKNEHIRFLQLRMINKLEIPGDADLADYLNLEIPKLPLDDAKSVSSITINTESYLGNDVGVIKLQSHNPEQPGTKLYLIEFGVTRFINDLTIGGVSDWLNNSNQLCYDMFTKIVKNDKQQN